MLSGLRRWANNKQGEQSNILTTANIHNFLESANNIVKPQNEQAQELIEARIEQLQGFRDNCIEREKLIYSHFGVENIGQLQARLDGVLEDLSNFQNKVLRAMPFIKTIDESQIVFSEVERQLQEQIDAWVDNNKEAKSTLGNNINNIVTTQLADMLQAARKENGSTVSRPTIRKALTQKRVNGKTKIVLKPGALKGYKKELEIALGIKQDEEDKMLYTFEVSYDTIGFNPDVLSYYPYYKLSDGGKEFAISKEGDSIWRKFKEILVGLVGGNTKNIAREVLDSGIIERSDFFVDSASEIIGVLGEFQALVLFTALTPNYHSNNSFISYVGNVLQQGKKIGIDMLLGGEGVQIKNYATYGKVGVNEGINLRESMTLDTFLGKLEGAASPEQLQTLADYYTIRAYHIGVNKDYAPTEKRLKAFDVRVKDFFQGYINYLLPLQTYSSIEKEAKVLATNTSNLFYFIGGRRLVPVSMIIQAYIDYLNKLREAQLGKIKRTLSVNFSYKGEDTYRNYYNLVRGKNAEATQEYINNFNYDNILNKINIDYTVNLNIDYVLQGVLTKT